MQIVKLLLTAISLLLPNLVSAQVWTQTTAPTNNTWQAVASSADGSKLVAVAYGGRIYTSTNYGGTWGTSNNAPLLNWISVASSADGSKLVAAADGGQIYTSTNAGVVWVANNIAHHNWNSIVSSADGSILAAVYLGNGVVVSTNFGASWVTNAIPMTVAVSLALSADGSKLAIGGGGSIVTSPNLGVDWNPITLVSGVAFSVASSADGSTLASVIRFGGNNLSLYSSTNYGISWVTNSGLGDSATVAVSAGGKRLIVISYGQTAYASTNSGNSWTSSSLPGQHWLWVASSADGGSLTAGVLGGGIWVSQTIIPPQLNIALSDTNQKLSWIVPSTNFVLQQSPDLQAWQDVTNTPALNYTNIQYEVVLPSPSQNTFYRLKTP